MRHIDISARVREYPDKDEDYHTLIIRPHWNEKAKVVLTLGEKDYTFIADDIRQAINACELAHRL